MRGNFTSDYGVVSLTFKSQLGQQLNDVSGSFLGVSSVGIFLHSRRRDVFCSLPKIMFPEIMFIVTPEKIIQILFWISL